MAITVTGDGCSVSYSDASDGFTGITGKYWIKAKVRASRYGKQRVVAPGVDGAAIGRLGFRARFIDEVEVVYVNTSVNATAGAYESDHGDAINKKVTVALHGLTFENCEMEAMDWIKGPKPTQQNGRYRLHVRLQFQQQRENDT